MFAKLFTPTPSLSPTKFFLVTASVFGLLFLIITPPFQGADEIVHFYRAYQVSQANPLSEQNQNKVGGLLPVSLGRVVADTNTPPIAFYPQLKYDEYKTIASFHVRDDAKLKKFYDFSATATYSPVPYAGASAGILASRILHVPTLAELYAGRLGNLVAWLALVGAAIFYMPRRRWVFVAIGLLPMAVFQAATLNGDAITIGSLMLLFALILNFRERNLPLKPSHIMALLACAIVMVLSKQVMFIFLPLFLLLGEKSFKTRQQAYVIKAALIFIPLLFFLAWTFVTRHIDGAASYTNHQDPVAQLSFILHNPHSYINTLWNTYFYTWSDNIVRSFIGVFGWADAPLSELIVTIGYLGLALLLVATYSNEKRVLFSKNTKLALWMLVGLYVLAVSTSLYLYYSPVAYKIIYGLQGRYFIPVVILCSVLAQSRSIRVSPELYRRVAVFLPLFLLTASSITAYVRYFVKNV